MRTFSRSVLGVLFVLLLGAFAWAFPVVPHAGTEADPALIYASPTCAAVFEDAYTGAGIVLVQADVQLLDVGGGTVGTYEVTTLSVANGMYRVPLRPYVETLPNGTYQIRVRVWDTYGNVSEWSNALFAAKQWKAIGRPGGCTTLP